MNKIKSTVFYSILVFLITCTNSWAATYFVDKSIGNDANSGTISKPWKTIKKANSTLKAGDTVYLRGGTYSGEQIAPANDGTASKKISYAIYHDEIVTIRDIGTGIDLNNRKHIGVAGSPTKKLFVTNCDHNFTMNNAHHNELAYLDLGKMRNFKSFKGAWAGAGSTYNWIHHCNVYKFGYYSSSQDYGDMFYIGASPALGNSYNLIEENHIYHGGHIPLKVTGKWNVIRNNYLHNEEWYPYDRPKYGNRAAAIIDYHDDHINGWNLIEGNRFAFTGIPSDANFSAGIQHTNHDSIIRKNMFYACKGPGLKIETIRTASNADDNYIYNNVFFYNGIGGVAEKYQTAIWLRANVSGNVSWNFDHTVIKNNIFYKNPKNIKTSGTVTNTIAENNWLIGDPKFIDAVPSKTVDPFNSDYPNFKLQERRDGKEGSPCIDAGGFLTKTVSAGNGNKIKVEDAHYFMDGWGIIEGDVIQLKGQTQTARIINVDYNSNTLTIDKALEWSANQGLSLSYSGKSPDIGAFESGADNSISLSPIKHLRVTATQ